MSRSISASAVKAVTSLDAWIDRTYQDILKHSDPEKNHLSPTIALYLYGRSFFLKDKPIADAHKKAVDYFIGQSQKYWLKLGNRQSQAASGTGLETLRRQGHTAGHHEVDQGTMLNEEEMGMYWRDLELSQWWYRAPLKRKP